MLGQYHGAKPFGKQRLAKLLCRPTPVTMMEATGSDDDKFCSGPKTLNPKARIDVAQLALALN